LFKSPGPVASAMSGENEPAQVVLSIVVCHGRGNAKLERAGLHIHSHRVSVVLCLSSCLSVCL
jgi:hypothetical protein